jgi:uncharacterized protein (TIGR02145 family)
MNTIIKTGLAAILLLAISCKKENNIIQSSGITDESATPDLITDLSLGKYASVKIGTQKWMTTNLSVNRYRNGDKIPQVRSNAAWKALTTGAWCWYNNDSANGAVYGKLYNWYAVNDPRGLAPAGWHVPSDAEWDTLETRLGKNAGGKLKDTGTIEAGTGLWHAPNKGATNKFGFTGLPGGFRDYNSPFTYIGFVGYWWSSTEDGTTNAWYRALDRIYKDIGGGGGPTNKRDGFSVRCIKD